MRMLARPRFVVVGFLVLLIGLAAEMSGETSLVEDLGVLAMIAALTLLAAILPSLLTGLNEEDRAGTEAHRDRE